MEQATIVRKLHALFHDEALLAASCPSFRRYFREFLADKVSSDVYIHKAAKALALTRGRGKRVLDVGCGFGLLTILLRLLGAKESCGIDHSQEKIDEAGKLPAFFGVDGVEFHRSGAEKMAFAAESFDVILCTAALSHIADQQAAMNEFARIVRPGGVIYIFEDNNATFFGYERSMRAVWHAAETGERPPGAGEIHMPPRPYRSIREEIIKTAHPQLPPDQVAYCVGATAGMFGAGLAKAVEEFRTTGRIVNREPFWCRHPVTGEYMEFPLRPTTLRDEFTRRGMAVKFHNPLTPPYRGLKGAVKRVISRAYDLWPKLTWHSSPIFILTATKRSQH